MLSRRAIAVVVLAVVLLTGCSVDSFHLRPKPVVARSAPAQTEPVSAVYVHYYLWWTPQHWHDKLGAGYPYGASPPPVPGSVSTDGCGAQVKYSGSQVVDLPAEGLYDQNLAATFDQHIQLAVAAGLRGFLVSWQGTGQPGQQPESSGYDRRLDLLVSRVRAYNATHGTRFSLGLAFASFGDYSRPASAIINDLSYFGSRYSRDSVFQNDFSMKPIAMWLDSRKYDLATVQAVSSAEERDLYLLGDETPSSWARDANYLDGTSYYWSTENPWTNAQAGPSLERLATMVHQAGKRWFAPFIAGYNKQLLGGSCVPRQGLETLDKVWEINAASRPDGWFGISWNEFVENTYLEPSRLYGTMYLHEVQRLSGH